MVPGSIHKNLKYFETIHADDLVHTVVKKGLKESSHPFNKIKEVNFKALGRDFRLILTPKKEVLHSKFKAYTVDAEGKETAFHIGKLNYIYIYVYNDTILIDHENFYNGRVFGETNSHVNMHIDDGMLTGSIHLPDEIYHLEVHPNSKLIFKF